MFCVGTLLCALLIQASLAQHTHDRSDLYSLLGYPDTEPGPNAEYQGNDKYYRPTNTRAQINRNPATKSQPVAQQQTYNQQQMIPQQPVATSQLQQQQYMQSLAAVQPAVQPQPIFQTQPVFRTQPLTQAQLATQAQPVVQRQPIVQTQPAMPMQPISQPRPLFNPQPVTQMRPIFNPQPISQPRYFQVVAQPPMAMQTQPLMQHQYMQPVVPTQQYLQSQQTRFLYPQPQQFMQRQNSVPVYNNMPAAATPFARTQNQENEKQGNGKRIGRIVPTIQSNLRRHQSPHIPSPPRANQHVIYGSRVPLFFFQHPGNIG